MPLPANGEAIEAAILALRISEKEHVTFDEIARRTEELGPGFPTVDVKTIYQARKSANIGEGYLRSLAEVLRMTFGEIVMPGAGADKQPEPSATTSSNHQVNSVNGNNARGYNLASNAVFQIYNGASGREPDDS